MRQLLLSDEAATLSFAGQCAKVLSVPCVILLSGELGSGKTCFTRGLLNGFGYSGAVKSPTYTLVESYSFPDFQFHHFDLYRLAGAEELEYLGLDYYFHNNAIVVIEWPERAQGLSLPADLHVTLRYHNASRLLQLDACSPRGEEMMCKLPD